jgi:hypothetical protein
LQAVQVLDSAIGHNASDEKNNDSAPMNTKPLIQMTFCRYKPNLKPQKMRGTKSDRIAWF